MEHLDDSIFLMQHRARISEVDTTTYPWARTVIEIIKCLAVRFEIIDSNTVGARSSITLAVYSLILRLSPTIHYASIRGPLREDVE